MDDSGSDWDSLSGGEEKNTSIAPSTTQQPTYQPPIPLHTPLAVKQEKTVSPKQTNATVFVDRGEYQESIADQFKEVELKDKSYTEKKHKRNKKQKSVKQEEDLPYTDFKAYGSPAKPSAKQQVKGVYENEVNTDEDVKEDVLTANNNDKHLYGNSYMEMYSKKSIKNQNKSQPAKVLSNEKYKISSNNDGRKFFYEKVEYEYHSVDMETTAIMPKYADKAEVYFKRLWREFFGLLRVLVDFVVIFVVELVSFLFGTLQKLLTGVVTATGDWLIKGVIATVFNAIVQPLLMFSYNASSALRRACEPLVGLFADVTQPVVKIIAAFRLVDYRRNDHAPIKDL